MAYDVLLKGGRVVDPANRVDGIFDLGIEGKRVAEVSGSIDPGSASVIYDVSGLMVMPGVIDLHVHTSRRHRGYNAHRMMARAGVVTAVDLAGPIDEVMEFCTSASAGLNMAIVQQVRPGVTVSSEDPSRSEIESLLSRSLQEGALGLKILGGHFPLTPEASRRTLEVCNREGAYVAFHSGTTETPGSIDGFFESLDLAGDLSVHIPHINAFCRGSIQSPLEETQGVLEALKGRPKVFTESHLATINGTSGRFIRGMPESQVTKGCLVDGGFEPTEEGFEEALMLAYAYISIGRGGENVLITGDEGVEAWHQNDTNVSAHFMTNPPTSRLMCAVARDECDRFIVDAIATDGGGHPRNIGLECGLALVRADSLNPSQLVLKLSCTPARILGLTRKGRLDEGADADITVADPETCHPVMTFGGGKLIMHRGAVVGTGTTIITTEKGQKAVMEQGLEPYVVDVSEGLFLTGKHI